MRTDVDFEYLSPLAYTVESNSREFQEQSDLSYFMKMVGRRKLLNAEEERELGTRLWTSRRRLLRILRASQIENRRAIVLDVLPPKRAVTASTRRRLARVERRAREAALPSRRLSDTLSETVAEMDDIRQTFVESNLRLVVWVAKRFRGRGFDFIDLIQEGSLGLMRAIDRFDPAVGARFSTFATHWIQQGIRRALAEKARTIRIPVNRISEVRETLLARAKIAEKLGRPALPEEIADAIGLPKHKVEELLPAIAPIDSIDSPLAATELKLGDTIEDRTTPTPLDEAIEEETRRAIASVLDALPPRQRVILSMRHGIGYPRVHPRGNRRRARPLPRTHPPSRKSRLRLGPRTIAKRSTPTRSPRLTARDTATVVAEHHEERAASQTFPEESGGLRERSPPGARERRIESTASAQASRRVRGLVIAAFQVELKRRRLGRLGSENDCEKIDLRTSQAAGDRILSNGPRYGDGCGQSTTKSAQRHKLFRRRVEVFENDRRLGLASVE